MNDRELKIYQQELVNLIAIDDSLPPNKIQEQLNNLQATAA